MADTSSSKTSDVGSSLVTKASDDLAPITPTSEVSEENALTDTPDSKITSEDAPADTSASKSSSQPPAPKPKPPSTSTVSELRFQEHRELFDIIDRLRSQGIDRYVDLPQIVVCGDQSSGKSSVLEAISGMTFPAQEGLCTRFPTELVLCRAPGATTCKVTITPHRQRNAEEQERLRAFAHDLDAETLDLGEVVEKAKDAMGIDQNKRFANDTLRVELNGPDQPHLTIIDLPGLFAAADKDQNLEDASKVDDMVLNYMDRVRTIILAVVSAKVEFSLQRVTAFTRRLDEKGDRTLGLITKPDTLYTDSPDEKKYLDMAQNNNVYFRLGWHVLRNRNYHERASSLAQRHHVEKQFLSKAPWNTLDEGQLGAASLKSRLSDILKDHILEQIDPLASEIQKQLQDCQGNLDKLGIPRTSVADQKRYLVNISKDITTLLEGATNGVYSDKAFFGDPWETDHHHRRLRAIVQKLLSDFSSKMAKSGHSYEIIENNEEAYTELAPEKRKSESSFGNISGDKPIKLSRNEYVKKVEGLMGLSRGRELPGLFNPLLVGDLFVTQSKRWKEIVYDVGQKISETAGVMVVAAVGHKAIPETINGVTQYISQRFRELETNLVEETEKLLDNHRSLHPITYNPSLPENVQRRQNERWQAFIEERFKQVLKVEKLEGVYPDQEDKRDFKKLSKQLADETTISMEVYAAHSATDYMLAYYDVSNNPHMLYIFPFPILSISDNQFIRSR